MLLYDGQSAIDWFYDALLTADEMMGREEYAHIFDGPAVLYDNGDGKVYGWETLEALCGKWAVPFSDDADSTFATLVEAMNPAAADPEPAPSPMTEQAIAAISLAIKPMTLELTPSECATVWTFTREWAVGEKFSRREFFQHKEKVYRASQDFTGQSQYEPGSADLESLFWPVEIADDGIVVYRTCHGEYDSVQEGETRHYPGATGKVYRSKVNNNSYAPDAYPQNWELVE